MKKVVFVFIFICFGICIAAACSRSDKLPQTPAKLFFVDAELNRLLPYEDELPSADAEYMARAALLKLAAGRPENDKIRQLVPTDKRSMRVSVKDNIAYVDLSSKIADRIPDSRDVERLFIYQIVDTLTSIKGIRYVRFTIDGEIHKDFLGYYDMRETYKYVFPE
ncbi:MAG: GerMN domain-containing protein [Clostridia bacterium]|nr:GerMN domain-containing protein [Clostridia bacterium]